MTRAPARSGVTAPPNRNLRRLLGAGAVLALTLAVAGRVAAQSFDCTRAHTPVEHRICDDPPLAALDTELAGALHAALLGPGDARSALLDEQRRWIATRDRQCLGEGDASSAHLSACLTGAYRQRIAELKARPGDPARAQYLAASCNKIAERYRALAEAHHGEAPLHVLAGTKATRVTVAPPVTTIETDQGAAAGFRRWARSQQPPVVVPDDLVGEDMGNSATLERLPDTGYYALSSVQGTAHCYYTIYFTIRNGRAREAAPPPGIDEEDGAGCMVTRSFGTLDDAPVHFEEAYLYTPQMSASLDVATWDTDHFGASCAVTFRYEPEFTEDTLNPMPDECTGTQCAALRQAARALVVRVQANLLLAHQEALAALTDAQRTQFLAAKKLAEADDAPGAAPDSVPQDPAEIIDQTPLRLPYVYGDHLYIAGIGHATIGWRYYADWSVTFAEPMKSKLIPRGTFSVGMRKGRLLSTDIKAN